MIFVIKKDLLALDEFSSVGYCSSSNKSLNFFEDSIEVLNYKNAKSKSFVKISGTIINIVEDQCFLILKCLNCDSVNDFNKTDEKFKNFLLIL
jgi:hypothetical protein